MLKDEDLRMSTITSVHLLCLSLTCCEDGVHSIAAQPGKVVHVESGSSVQSAFSKL